jgi:hypothetical protein
MPVIFNLQSIPAGIVIIILVIIIPAFYFNQYKPEPG